MKNTFYNDFDRSEFSPENQDYRTSFQRSRDRLIHNSAFRRMQAKTQVFLSGEYDFYRTRLTHSIEVAQIAGSISGYLNWSSDELSEDFHIDRDLVEAVALAHDIGHPPYGHAGENTLHRLLKPYGGFEGNAQTLRLITQTIFTSGPQRRGLNPTRALIDGVLKYKSLYSELDNPENHFIYDDQVRYLEFITDGQPFPPDLTPGKSRNSFRSLECQIMDWADDTAYSLNDLSDSINAGFINGRRVRRWAVKNELDGAGRIVIEDLLKAIEDGTIERTMNHKIGTFVAACSLHERENFMAAKTNRYRFGLVIDPLIKAEQKIYTRLAHDLVFRSPQVCQLEHKGGIMLTRIFETLRDSYLGANPPRQILLSRDFEREILAETDQSTKARIICDYLAGMTDGYATRIYKRLFDPEFGSIIDLV